MIELTPRDCELLNEIQSDFPLDSRPFASIAKKIGVSEEAVISRLQALESAGAISRFGAVFQPNVAGASTLVALRVPVEHLEGIAKLINAIPGVNHNYLREHQYNLWFVITGKDRNELDRRLAEVRKSTNYPMLDLPMEQPYHINLGFAL